MSPSFLLNMNFPLLCKVHVYIIISFVETCFLKPFYKASSHFHYKAKRETELKNFFALIFRGLKHDIWPCWCHQRSLEARPGTSILPKPKNVMSILTETHINHDQIHHTRNNWLGPIFFSPGDTHTKGMLFLLHLGLEGVTEVDNDPKERFVSFKVTTSNESFLFVPLQSIAPESSWLGGTFLKDYKSICKIKMREMKTK